VDAGAGGGGDDGECAGPGDLGSEWGRPPCDEVRGRASLERPGDEGAVWRWW